MAISGTEFNVVDLVVFFLLLFSILGGIRKGFIGGFFDLFGVVAGMYLSFRVYRPVAAFLTSSLPIGQGIANLAAFTVLFIISQILFSFLFGWLSGGITRLLQLVPPLRFANALGGALPGLVKGIVGVALLLLPFGLFPLVPSVQDAIENSFIGSHFLSLASQSAPRLETLFGQATDDTLVFLTRPETSRPLKLNLIRPTKLVVDVSSEQKMLELVNAERVKVGLQPLVLDENLRQAARAHSQEMFERSYFAHESPVTGSPSDRMLATGARFTLAGENIAYAPNVDMAHTGLMNSPGHRQNILEPDYRRIGIGVIDGGLSGKMFTQDFSD